MTLLTLSLTFTILNVNQFCKHCQYYYYHYYILAWYPSTVPPFPLSFSSLCTHNFFWSTLTSSKNSDQKNNNCRCDLNTGLSWLKNAWNISDHRMLNMQVMIPNKVCFLRFQYKMVQKSRSICTVLEWCLKRTKIGCKNPVFRTTSIQPWRTVAKGDQSS